MTLPGPSAVIFDWDDTVVDTWPVIVASFNETLAAMGRDTWSDATARENIGPPAEVIFTRLFGAEKWREANGIYLAAYKKIASSRALRVYPHIEDIFKSLRARGISLAVVSSKRGPLLREEAEQAGLAHYFGGIVGAGDAPADKPHIDAVLMALEGSGIAPGPHVWFIGDGHTDMLCAHNAGCTPILIETKPPPEELLFKNPPALRIAGHGQLMEFLVAYFG